ncbi:MAG: hypothetical protein NTW29_18030 [Bacteroidetes bacterium]|nr:hypothetical protein [Bacteroidota bacterium]
MRKLILLFAICFFYSAQSHAQDTLKQVLSKSEIETPYFCIDENGKEYQYYTKLLSYYIDFTKVEQIGKCDSFLIEGYALLSNTKDYGMTGITIFLGQLRTDTIYSIRNRRISNDMVENPQHEDGFFSLVCRVFPDDKLFFSDVHGGGLTVFDVGKLASKNIDGRDRCRDLPQTSRKRKG